MMSNIEDWGTFIITHLKRLNLFVVMQYNTVYNNDFQSHIIKNTSNRNIGIIERGGRQENTVIMVCPQVLSTSNVSHPTPMPLWLGLLQLKVDRESRSIHVMIVS